MDNREIRERQDQLERKIEKVGGGIQEIKDSVMKAPKSMSTADQLKAIGTVVSIIVAICAGIWWSIQIATDPLEDAMEDVQKDVTESLRQGTESKVRLEDIRRRLEVLERSPSRFDFDGQN